MHVRSITLQNFGSYESATLALPARGVVVIVGCNRAGKSTLLEAIATALWGESLRGAPLWRDGTSLRVETDTVIVERTRDARRWHVSYAVDSVTTQCETATKTQAKLDALIGSFDVWRRSHVLSSDTRGFASATDAERKRLLEEMLSVSALDTAHERARVALRNAEQHNARAEAREESAMHRASSARAALDRALTTETTNTISARTDADIRAELVIVDSARVVASEQRDTARDALDIARSASAALGHETQTARTELARVRAGRCALCDRPFDGADIAVAQRACDETISHAMTGQARCVVEIASATEQLGAARVELEKLDASRIELLSELAAMSAAREANARNAALVADMRAEVTTAEASLATARAERAAAVRALVLHEAAVQVLGLRGVRAAVLGQALGALEGLANGWLARLAPGLALTLTGPQAGSGERLGLEVLGAGGGSFQGTSGGERRRVDVALTLALAELAQHGEPGSLLVDECFDALDADGARAVCSVLEELAENRLVVIITHNTEIAEGINAVKRFRVEREDGGYSKLNEEDA